MGSNGQFSRYSEITHDQFRQTSGPMWGPGAAPGNQRFLRIEAGNSQVSPDLWKVPRSSQTCWKQDNNGKCRPVGTPLAAHFWHRNVLWTTATKKTAVRSWQGQIPQITGPCQPFCSSWSFFKGGWRQVCESRGFVLRQKSIMSGRWLA